MNLEPSVVRPQVDLGSCLHGSGPAPRAASRRTLIGRSVRSLSAYGREPAGRSFPRTARARRQPIRSGRDPGLRRYAPTGTQPGKQGRKHYPHPPCRFRAAGSCADSPGGRAQIDRFGDARCQLRRSLWCRPRRVPFSLRSRCWRREQIAPLTGPAGAGGQALHRAGARWFSSASLWASAARARAPLWSAGRQLTRSSLAPTAVQITSGQSTRLLRPG